MAYRAKRGQTAKLTVFHGSRRRGASLVIAAGGKIRLLQHRLRSANMASTLNAAHPRPFEPADRDLADALDSLGEA